MIVAGSVLAMLLMGFAVEGFVNSVDEDDDTSGDADGDITDQSGISTTALSDLLFAADGGDSAELDDYASDTQHSSMALDYTPLDQIELDDEDDANSGIVGDFRFDDDAIDDSEETKADSEWAALAAGPAAAAFMDIEDLTVLEDGSEVSLVADFNTATDELILEFDGTSIDMPEIEVDLDTEQGAGLVLANGIPVTLVEGATDLTAEHVRVVMNGEETVGTPEMMPDATENVQPMKDEEAAFSPADTGADDVTLEQQLAQILDAPTADMSEGAETSNVLGVHDDESGFFTGEDTAEPGLFDDDPTEDADGNHPLDYGADLDLLFGDNGDDVLLDGALSDTFIDGEYVENAEVAGHVVDFDPRADRIEVIFDPDVNPNPQVEVQDFEDGSGADILLNGSVILSVSGAQGMDPNLIDLREVA